MSIFSKIKEVKSKVWFLAAVVIGDVALIAGIIWLGRIAANG